MFNDFVQNQLTKFRAVFHPAGCFKYRCGLSW